MNVYKCLQINLIGLNKWVYQIVLQEKEKVWLSFLEFILVQNLYQPIFKFYYRFPSLAHDRSRSPTSQRSESPTHSTQQTVQSKQEPDLKVTKDATSPILKFEQTTTTSSSSSNDQQVPSTDSPITVNIPSSDPNTIALEKLEEIKQNLADLNQQVDAFTGSTRDDRIYKGLDEQALKMMIRCDELIDVSADIKEKRKETIRNVQTVLAKLESKVPMNSATDSSSNEMETALTLYDSSKNSIDQLKPSDAKHEETTTDPSV